MTADPDPPTLTTKDVADIFGVTAITIARWADAGHLPCIRTLGGHRRFRASDVRAVQQAHERRPRD